MALLGEVIKKALDNGYSNNKSIKVLVDSHSKSIDLIDTMDIENITRLGSDCEESRLLLATKTLDNLNKNLNKIISTTDIKKLETIVSLLLETKWDINLKNYLQISLQEEDFRHSKFTNIIKFGRAATDFINRVFEIKSPAEHTYLNKEDIAHFDEKLFNATQDILLLSPANALKRTTFFFNKWKDINSVSFVEQSFSHKNIWRVMADYYYSSATLGPKNIAIYGDSFKHAKIKNSNILEFWDESLKLLQNTHSSFALNQDSAYNAEASSISTVRMRVFWFKQALRSGLNIEDIQKLPNDVSDLLLQSATVLYIRDKHPMIGNFLKTVVPMLRESIDMGLIDLSNFKNVSIQFFSQQIENEELPELGIEYKF